jgi:hypothetical protein
MPSWRRRCFLNVIKLLTGILGVRPEQPTIPAD